MKQFLRKAVCLLLVCVLLLGSLAACTPPPEKEGKITLSSEGNVTTVVPGGSLQLTVVSENVDESLIEFTVSGGATITSGALLSVAGTTAVGTQITVTAKAGEVTSNTFTVTVGDIHATAMTLTAQSDVVTKGSSVNLAASFTPANATATAYTLSIVAGAEYATLSDNTLSVASESSAEEGDTVTVKATLTSNPSVTATVSVTVVDPVHVDTILAENIEMVATTNSQASMDITSYNSLFEEIPNVPLTNFSYVSSNENVVTVSAAGVLTAVGHGEAIITIKRLDSNEELGTCRVYVMVPPDSLRLEGLSSHILTAKELFYSRVDALSLSVVASSSFATCSRDVVYSFAKLGTDNETVATGDDVATVTDGAITFHTTGKILVTVTSSSSLNHYDVSASEQSLTLTVNVNDGVNIDTVAELVAYAKQTVKEDGHTVDTVIANITADLFLTEDDNFGKTASHYNTLEFYGDRIIFGNGYLLSTERLPLIEVAGDTNEGLDMLKFFFGKRDVPFTVQISDLTVIGCSGVDGRYSGKDEGSKGKETVNTSNGDFIRTYKRGIHIYGNEYHNLTDGGKAYVKDMLLDNVSVSGFQVALRINHAVDGILRDIAIDNCFSNGMELNQNTLTVHNITLGKVGAFGIEMTPDDMADKATASPKGTAGANYDEVPSLNMTGTIYSDNYSNGRDTLYMQGLEATLSSAFGLQITVADLVDTVALSTIGGLVGDIQDTTIRADTEANLSRIYNECVVKEEGGEKWVNFYLLIYVDFTEFTAYPYGNAEDKFGIYQNTANIANMTDILAAAKQNPEYDGYKQYQYIEIDLYLSELNYNIGQVIVVNRAYDASYTPAQ